MAFKDRGLRIADCGLRFFARAARFEVLRLDAALAGASNRAFASRFAGYRLQF